jgi:hypothetical protein
VASTEIRPQPDEPSLDALDIMLDVPEVLRAKWRRRQYRDGDLVVASGAPADRLMILVRGHLAIVEAETRIATRSAIRLIGELAFIDDKPRSASVFAEGAVVTYELVGRDVPELMPSAAISTASSAGSSVRPRASEHGGFASTRSCSARSARSCRAKSSKTCWQRATPASLDRPRQ